MKKTIALSILALAVNLVTASASRADDQLRPFYTCQCSGAHSIYINGNYVLGYELDYIRIDPSTGNETPISNLGVWYAQTTGGIGQDVAQFATCQDALAGDARCNQRP